MPLDTVAETRTEPVGVQPMRPWPGVAAATAAGVVLALAYPPFGWWWLAVPAAAVLPVVVRRLPGAWWAALAGLGFGLGFFGLLFPWLAELGFIAFAPLWLLQAAFFAVLAPLLWRARHRSTLVWVLVVAAGWGLMEWARARYPLGGFPWGKLAFPLGDLPVLRATARWVGSTGLSMLGAGLAAGLGEAAVGRRWRPVVVPAVVVAVAALAGAAFPATADGDVVRVAVVQGSTPCPGTHCENERFRTYQTHLELTRTLEPGTVDLVVWPEGSTGGFRADPVLVPEVGEAMAAEAERLGAVLLAGGDRPISDTEWINANVLFTPDGELWGEYRKQHPVPFGEYVPAREWFTWVEELEAVPRDMVRGDGPVVVDLGFGPFGSVISFEGAFGRYARENARAGAELLVVATNQGSYPYSPASDQFIRMTRMRSAELGLDVVHAAVTGRSTIITDGGRIGEVTPLAEPAVLRGEVQLRDAPLTLYARWGDWLVWVLAAAAAGAVIVDRRRAA